MKTVTARPLTAEAFAPYGSVADISELENLVSLADAYEGTGEAKHQCFNSYRRRQCRVLRSFRKWKYIHSPARLFCRSTSRHL